MEGKVDIMFERTLKEVVKGVRNCSPDQLPQFLATVAQEVKKEVRSKEPHIKAQVGLLLGIHKALMKLSQIISYLSRRQISLPSISTFASSTLTLLDLTSLPFWLTPILRFDQIYVTGRWLTTGQAVGKLVYMHLLGQDVSEHAFSIVECMSLSSFAYKRIGYVETLQIYSSGDYILTESLSCERASTDILQRPRHFRLRPQSM